VWDYLRSKAAVGTKDQEVLDIGGSFLFRGSHIRKQISVLSGGERARLCMAGLLLSKHNILILDEPGNHLDVDTVEALAEALIAYEGTLIFTSHDRHFLKRVASSIIEVRDGRVVNYRGQYETYLARVEDEIDAGERELATERKKLPPEVLKASAAARPAIRSEKEARKELKTTEKQIAQLDTQKKALTTQFLNSTNDKESKRLDSELATVTDQLGEAEERWSQINEELEAMG